MTIKGDHFGLTDFDTTGLAESYMPEYLARYYPKLVGVFLEELDSPGLVFDTSWGLVGKHTDDPEVIETYGIDSEEESFLELWIHRRLDEMDADELSHTLAPLIVNGINAEIRSRANV